MSNISIVIDEADLRRLVLDHLRTQIGDIDLVEKDIQIETKSSQNYRSEWERGAGFRATVNRTINV